MLPFRKILFPVDYSPPCEAVIPYVKETARRFSADLTVVHAYGAEALASSPLPLTDPDLPNEARAHEARRLRDFAQNRFPGQHVETIAEVGAPGAIIDRVVQHQGTDLVMLPTHGFGPIRRLLLGSVTAKVLHDLSTAVWTGTGSCLAHHSPVIPYKTVLCALDVVTRQKAC
jgi:nucleotide-binding universal stress UspA family protein